MSTGTIEIGSRVKFTGFKDHDSDLGYLLAQQYPSLVVGSIGVVRESWDGGREAEVTWDDFGVQYSDVLFDDELELVK